MIKKTLITILCILLLPSIALLLTKYVLTQNANRASEQILIQARANTPEETAENAARLLYIRFSKSNHNVYPNLAKARPYISNDKMPTVFRTPPGAVELNTLEGWCDESARALIYVLARDGIQAEQWNMQGPSSAHAAVRVKFNNGTSALIDPFYGFSSVQKTETHDPLDIQESIRKGGKIEQYLKAFDQNSNKEFYNEFGELFMGAQGEPLTLKSDIPRVSERTELGIEDRKGIDARRAILKNDMTLGWEYVGHKYDRGWTKILTAQQPLKFEIILIRNPEDQIVRTLSPKPEISGKKLIWNLAKNEQIIAKDALAGISPFRLSSYIDIDQIVITPEGDQP